MFMPNVRDIEFMQLALEQAKLAQQINEVPVGAILVSDNTVIASGHNQPINQNDPSAHAEMVTGCAHSVLNLFDNKQLNHHTIVEGGVLEEECSNLLKNFFKERRSQSS